MRALFEFEGHPLLFEHPREVIRCDAPAGLRSCFERVERAIRDGYYAAGFLSYEAGYAFEPLLAPLHRGDFPLLLMGIFSRPLVQVPRASGASFQLDNLQPSLLEPEYAGRIAAIQHSIQNGEVYQITFCLKYFFGFTGSAYDLYRQLLNYQPVPYPAYLESDGYTILSLSPEMFVKKREQRVTTKPMKGSWPRGQGLFKGLGNGLRLHWDSKNRAENVMIADLLRNDLGRIGGRVTVPRLFEVEAYRTIFQMTSTVCAEVKRDLPFYDFFSALFPSGSVTGAPKITAMRIIHQLEENPRKIYTGALGWITPERDLFFNVPIRTLLLQGTRSEMGIGGGIVWDSTAEGEWQESLWKSRFLRDIY